MERYSRRADVTACTIHQQQRQPGAKRKLRSTRARRREEVARSKLVLTKLIASTMDMPGEHCRLIRAPPPPRHAFLCSNLSVSLCRIICTPLTVITKHTNHHPKQLSTLLMRIAIVFVFISTMLTSFCLAHNASSSSSPSTSQHSGTLFLLTTHTNDSSSPSSSSSLSSSTFFSNSGRWKLVFFF